MPHEAHPVHTQTAAPPIFIAGCEASGTNLTSQILDSHSRIAVCRGAQYYLLFASERRFYGDLRSQRNLRRLIDDFLETTRAHDIDSPSRDAMLRQLREPTFEGVLDAFLTLYAGYQAKVRAAERSVRNYAFLPQILEGFPRSPVVFMMRDPRDLALAHKQGFGFSVESAAASWNQAFHAYERASRHVHLLRYEALVQRPEETVQALCTFIGECYEPEMLRFHERTPAQYRALPHHERLSRPLGPEAIGHFRELPDAEIELIERMCAVGMRALEYTPVSRVVVRPATTSPRHPAFWRRVRDRMRYYRWNPARWRRGLLHWKIVARARVRFILRF